MKHSGQPVSRTVCDPARWNNDTVATGFRRHWVVDAVRHLKKLLKHRARFEREISRPDIRRYTSEQKREFQLLLLQLEREIDIQRRRVEIYRHIFKSAGRHRWPEPGSRTIRAMKAAIRSEEARQQNQSYGSDSGAFDT